MNVREKAKARLARFPAGDPKLSALDALMDAEREIERLRDELNRSRSYRESLEGLPEGTLPRV